jgi:GrpB-like predicted nucleotidyltransferase (UPF0157 family)
VAAGVVVVEYDPEWPHIFEAIRAAVSRALGGLALDIEHVGSTAVPGLPAKPIVDIDVIVRPVDVVNAIRCLAQIGYVHEGDLGVPGREVFIRPAGTPAHHLYVCPVGSPTLRAHLRFRDYLRANPAAAGEYAALKRTLASEVGDDPTAYTARKGTFIEAALRESWSSP